MIGRCAVALALGCGWWASAARADDTADDIKCLTVSLAMSHASDADLQSVGILSTMYWMGRLDGRAPNLDLEKRLDDAGGLAADDFKAEAVRCSEVLRARSEFLTKMGQDKAQRDNPK